MTVPGRRSLIINTKQELQLWWRDGSSNAAIPIYCCEIAVRDRTKHVIDLNIGIGIDPT